MKELWNRLLFFLIFLIIQKNVFAQTAPTDTLGFYYEYSKLEDIEKFISLFDKEGLSQEELNMQRDIALILWQKFDTLEYKLNIKKQTIKGDYALIDYNLNAKIKSIDEKSEEADISQDLTAFLVKNKNNWKINYIGNSDIFYERVESFAIESQSQIINEINKDTLENKIKQKTFEDNTNIKGNNSDICMASLIMFLAIGFFSIFKRN